MQVVVEGGHFAEAAAEQFLHSSGSRRVELVDAGSSMPSLSIRKNTRFSRAVEEIKGDSNRQPLLRFHARGKVSSQTGKSPRRPEPQRCRQKA